MPAEQDFAARLLQRVLAATHERAPGMGGRARALAGRAGLTRPGFGPDAGDRLAAVLADDGYARAHALLADEASRALLLDLLAFRVLGPWHVGLPVRPDAYAALCARTREERRVGGDEIQTPAGHPVPLLEWPGVEGPIRGWLHEAQVVALHDLRQYAHPRVQVRPGDVVIEAGAAWGETALAFADAAGPTGAVVSCEPVEENLAMLERNLGLNDRLAARITVMEAALWDEPGVTLRYTPAAGETSLTESGPASVTTTTVDLLALPRVDFLKLDVEGAELAALRGARATLERDRPALAISAYHRPEDLALLPAFIADLGLGYELYLGHFTPGLAETVLFARAPRA